MLTVWVHLWATLAPVGACTMLVDRWLREYGDFLQTAHTRWTIGRTAFEEVMALDRAARFLLRCVGQLCGMALLLYLIEAGYVFALYQRAELFLEGAYLITSLLVNLAGTNSTMGEVFVLVQIMCGLGSILLIYETWGDEQEHGVASPSIEDHEHELLDADETFSVGLREP